jgi:ABC-type multidrug transport system fused ATPase/permease subunit
MGLLIPMLNGLLTMDFSFMKELPVLGEMLQYLPESILRRDRSLFAVLIGIFAISVILKNVCKYASSLSLSFIGARALHHLRKLLFTRYLEFGKSYFDRTTIGHHSTVFSEFSTLALNPFLRINADIHAVFSLSAYLVLMALISWKLTLFAIPLFIILHFSVRTIIYKIYVHSNLLIDESRALGKKVVETLSIMPLVKASNTEAKERQEYTHLSDRQATLEYRINVLKNLIMPVQELVTLVALVILLSTMLYLLVQGGGTSAPSFMVYFYLVFNSASKFGTLTAARSHIASASGALNEIMKVLDDADKEYVQDGKRIFERLKQGIEFRNLSFSYKDGRKVLQGLNLSIAHGKMTAIVGPTGAGKSTIIQLIMRYYDCTPGTLLVDGTDIREFTAASLRSHIGLVSQDTLLLHESLKANIMYGLSGKSNAELQEAVRRARLSEFIEHLPNGLDTLVGDRGVQLSGGEKQRVSIARSLLKGAEILILDEATSSLDSRTEKFIQEAIDDAMQGRTAIVIAHRLSTIKHADSIAVLENGRCVQQGTLATLLEKPGLFRTLWEEQKFI